MESAPHLILVGEMAVGKTTVGRSLARHLHRPFFDSDEAIESSTGMTGRAHAIEQGVAHLHRLELEVFHDAAATADPSVIAAAASVIEAESARRILDRHDTVWLRAPLEVVAERVGEGGHRRLVDWEEARRLRRRRRSWYQECSKVEVDTTGRSPRECVDLILDWLGSRRAAG